MRKIFSVLPFVVITPVVAEPDTLGVTIEWNTEAVPIQAFETGGDVNARFFGSRDFADNAANDIRKNDRISRLQIAVAGVAVPVSGWMYMDLANPRADTKRTYGNKDSITIQFRVGDDASATWEVTYRLVASSAGYSVVQRNVCNAEMKPDACILTIRNIWPYE